MTDQSFFHLAPHNDPVLDTDPQMDWLCSLDEPEYEAMMDESACISEVLFEALNTYCETHPAPSYRTLIETLKFMRWVMEQRIAEDNADA